MASAASAAAAAGGRWWRSRGRAGGGVHPGAEATRRLTRNPRAPGSRRASPTWRPRGTKPRPAYMTCGQSSASAGTTIISAPQSPGVGNGRQDDGASQSAAAMGHQRPHLLDRGHPAPADVVVEEQRAHRGQLTRGVAGAEAARRRRVAQAPLCGHQPRHQPAARVDLGRLLAQRGELQRLHLVVGDEPCSRVAGRRRPGRRAKTMNTIRLRSQPEPASSTAACSPAVASSKTTWR